MKPSLMPGTILLLLLVSAAAAGESKGSPSRPKAVRERVMQFDLVDDVFVDGVAKLSEEATNLHMGLEEILRDKPSDPPVDVRFSLHLRNKSVGEIIDALCRFDSRYTWSVDGDSINIYPRATVGDTLYLLNRHIDRLALDSISNADAALTPLARQLPPPKEQLGYLQAGGDVTYAEPWTTVFTQITVRQFVNRVAEHLGTSSSWIFQGSKEERMFTFERGGFHSRTGPK